jgi:hypothetical protein
MTVLKYDHSCLDGVRSNKTINKIIRLVNNTPIAINDITGIKMFTPWRDLEKKWMNKNGGTSTSHDISGHNNINSLQSINSLNEN